MGAHVVVLEVGILEVPPSFRTERGSAVQHAVPGAKQDLSPLQPEGHLRADVIDAPGQLVIGVVEVAQPRLREGDGLHLRRVFPDYTGRPVPRAWLTWEENATGLSKPAVLDALANGSPTIRLLEEYGGDGLLIDPTTLLEGQESIIAERLRAIFTSPGTL